MLREFRMLLLGEQLELQKRLNDLAIWYLSPAIAKHCPPVTFATSVPFDFINQHPKPPVEHLYHHYCDLLASLDLVANQPKSAAADPPTVPIPALDSIQPKRSKPVRNRLSAAETNQRVSEWLCENAKGNLQAISSQQIADAIGASKAAVIASKVWKLFHQGRLSTCPPKKREVPLTDQMMATIHQRESKTPDELVAEKELEQLTKQQADEMRRDRRTPRRAKHV
ncbi:unnamed protein product [Tuwongella immobilis]|uniref:Uncharacterized protein n=2 Tax=Tuwongella immobilis TaxID=692036 RepID=A0A6C2YII2_9BACT|nr:unnamed protein product [Tuwongella immobilis]VTR97587.1 unnamed protein product [Tuwongella immobilis]